MDFSLFFSTAVVAGIPLLVVVLGLVQWIKKLGLDGKAAQIASMCLGLVFGGGYELSKQMPTDFAGWFAVAVFGILVGLIASGIYEVFNTPSKSA